MSSHPLPRLLRYASSHRSRILAASLCSFLNKLFDLAPPLLIGMAVDVVVERERSFLATWAGEGVLEQLYWVAGLTVLIWFLESVFQYLYDVLWREVAQGIEHDLRLDAYGHIQDLDLRWFEERSTGGLMAVLNDDVNQLERFLDGGANSLLQVSTTVVLVSAYFLAMSPLVAALAMLPIPLILWGSFHFQRRIVPLYAAVREQVAELSGLLSNNLHGIATIKSFTTEAYERERVRRESAAYLEANRAAIRLSAAFSPLIRMVIVCGFTGTLVAGGWMVESGRLAVGSYSVLLFLTQRLLWPLTRLGATLDLYQRAMASTTRILDLIDTPLEVVDGPESLPLEEIRGALSFQGVEFAYRPEVPVLRGLDLEVEAGQEVGVVGATGAGKTTLVKLLLRFYTYQGGRILLDGRELGSLRLADLRRAVALVSQDVYLFHGTVLENIAYGDPEPDRERVAEAVRLAELGDLLEALPEGLETVIGERGKKLSGGQRQRLSIARAVYKDAPILVLDEATSSVDNETEAAIQRSMTQLRRGRTVFVIAHRLSTVRDADRLFVLEAGRVAEQGTHEELLAAGGLYAALWRVQTGG